MGNQQIKEGSGFVWDDDTATCNEDPINGYSTNEECESNHDPKNTFQFELFDNNTQPSIEGIKELKDWAIKNNIKLPFRYGDAAGIDVLDMIISGKIKYTKSNLEWCAKTLFLRLQPDHKYCEYISKIDDRFINNVTLVEIVDARKGLRVALDKIGKSIYKSFEIILKRITKKSARVPDNLNTILSKYEKLKLLTFEIIQFGKIDQTIFTQQLMLVDDHIDDINVEFNKITQIQIQDITKTTGRLYTKYLVKYIKNLLDDPAYYAAFLHDKPYITTTYNCGNRAGNILMIIPVEHIYPIYVNNNAKTIEIIEIGSSYNPNEFSSDNKLLDLLRSKRVLNADTINYTIESTKMLMAGNSIQSYENDDKRDFYCQTWTIFFSVYLMDNPTKTLSELFEFFVRSRQYSVNIIKLYALITHLNLTKKPERKAKNQLA